MNLTSELVDVAPVNQKSVTVVRLVGAPVGQVGHDSSLFR
jgi:hypothetical protein